MDQEKFVDESWKETAELEKTQLQDSPEEQERELKVNFFNYISSLSFQTMIFLGEIDNPITQKNDKNMPQARFLIDTLAMIKDKTKGNLTKEEENLLNTSLYELQLKFVATQQRDAQETK